MNEQQGDKKSIFCSYKLADAQKHRRATSYGTPINLAEKCSCCNRISSKSKLSLCFGQSQLFYCGTQIASYLYLLKSVLVQFVLLGLVYCVPVLFLNYRNNGCQTVLLCQNTFTSLFSTFNSFDNSSSLDFIFYLTIPAVIINFLLFLIKSRLLSSLRIRQQQLGLFPDSCAVFLQLPFNHLTDSFVITQIESWWEKEAKQNQQYFDLQFSQLKEDNHKDNEVSSSKSSELGGPKSRRESLLIYEIIFSYSYPQFRAFKNEIQVFTNYFQTQGLVNKQEMNILIGLHQKKKKVLHETAKNKFCIVLFKHPKYAQYFHQKAHSSLFQSMFFFQKKRQFEIQGESVKVERGYYPSQLYWHNMHLTFRQKLCKRILGYIVFLIMLIGSTGCWYGACLLHIQLVSNKSSLIKLFIIVAAIASNSMAIILSKIVKLMCEKQERKSYSQENSAFIIKTTLLNVNLLYLSPFVIYFILDSSFLWIQNGFILLAYWIIGIFVSVSLVGQYLNFSFLQYVYYSIILDETGNYVQKQANQHYQKPPLKLQQNAVQLITISFLNALAIPFHPLICTFSLLWAFLFYWIQKINICNLRKEDPMRGQTLTLSISYILQFSPLLLIGSCFSLLWVASVHQSYSLNNIVVISLLAGLAAFSLIYLFLPIQTLISVDWSKSIKLKQLQYCELRSTSLELYQKYNNPYLFGTNEKSKDYSVRVKIFQEMNTMSKTLTQSLKDRLLSYQHPVLNNNDFKQEEEDDDDKIDHIYFQYQKKVEMKKSLPKIQIPRLFRAQAQQWKNNQIQLEDKININSLFSEDDESNKRLVKKMIKQKVRQQGLIK